MIKFYRGLKNLYDSALHGNGIYFTTDTLEIIHGDKSYSGLLEIDKYVATVVVEDEAMVITYSDGSTMSFEINTGDQLEVVDNLTSDSSISALSANLGKILLSKIDNIAAKLVSIYTYKGSKDTYEELPTNAEIGDVWNVVSAYGENPAGTNYAWVGDLVSGRWDALGGSVDLTNYYSKEAVDNLITPVTTQVDNLTLVINGNQDQLGLVGRIDLVETLIGDPTDEDKTETLLSRVTALESLLSTGSGDLLQQVNANTLAIANLENTVCGESGLVKAVETLNGSETVEGSVDNKINQAFAWIEIQ